MEFFWLLLFFKHNFLRKKYEKQKQKFQKVFQIYIPWYDFNGGINFCAFLCVISLDQWRVKTTNYLFIQDIALNNEIYLNFTLLLLLFWRLLQNSTKIYGNVRYRRCTQSLPVFSVRVSVRIMTRTVPKLYL